MWKGVGVGKVVGRAREVEVSMDYIHLSQRFGNRGEIVRAAREGLVAVRRATDSKPKML